MQFDQLRRREFITLVGGAAIAWPIEAGAQQSGKLPTIGFLGTNTASSQREWTDAFLQRLRELGWTEGRNLAIEYRWAEGRLEQSAEIVAELVRLKVDVIVTHSAEPVLAAKRETAVIPIVFPVAADPVGSGLVASLTRPGGNATGLSLQATDAAGKRVEILREVLFRYRCHRSHGCSQDFPEADIGYFRIDFQINHRLRRTCDALSLHSKTPFQT